MKCGAREDGKSRYGGFSGKGNFGEGVREFVHAGHVPKLDRKFGWAARNLVGGRETLLAVRWMA